MSVRIEKASRPEPAYLGAYWGPRRESIATCSESLASCLQQMAQIHDAFGSWFRKGTNPRKGLPVPMEPSVLRSLLLETTEGHARKYGEFPELGYSASLWNGEKEGAISFRVSCGSSDVKLSWPNSFLLNLPIKDPQVNDLYSSVCIHRVLEIIVEVWQPDWAVVATRSLRSTITRAGKKIAIGWKNYSSSPIADTQLKNFEVSELLGGSLFSLRGELDQVDIAAFQAGLEELDQEVC